MHVRAYYVGQACRFNIATATLARWLQLRCDADAAAACRWPAQRNRVLRTGLQHFDVATRPNITGRWRVQLVCVGDSQRVCACVRVRAMLPHSL